jgi:hypothetical protein
MNDKPNEPSVAAATTIDTTAANKVAGTTGPVDGELGPEEIWREPAARLLARLASSVAGLGAADSALATSRMIISGLRKRARNCSQSGERLTVAASLGP